MNIFDVINLFDFKNDKLNSYYLITNNFYISITTYISLDNKYCYDLEIKKHNHIKAILKSDITIYTMFKSIYKLEISNINYLDNFFKTHYNKKYRNIKLKKLL